jgi:adenylate cyclase
MEPDEYAAHGLYDPAAPDPGRLELLDFLVSQGVTLEEIAAAEGANRLGSVFTDRVAGMATLTLEDVAGRIGLPAELVARVWRAAGFPDPEPGTPIFSEGDAEAVTLFALSVGIFGEEEALQLVRVVGSSLARIAEAQLTSALANVPGAFFRTATSPLDSVRTSATLLSLVPLAEQAMNQFLRRHLVTANRRYEQMMSSPTRSEVVDLAVGFADLTGSTRLSVELSWEEFAQAMGAFEALTTDLVTAGGGRMVKLIGDEVMFVAPTSRGAVTIAVSLLRALADHPVLPGLRVGLAAGSATARDGDYFGPVVSLASRLVDIAPAGELVVSQEVAAAVEGTEVDVESLGVRTLQGFPDAVEVFRLTG